MVKLTSGDLLLLLLYARGITSNLAEPILGRTRLVKTAFLFEKEVYEGFKKDNPIEADLPEFFPWNFGPMAKEVPQDLEFFIKIKFIEALEEKNTVSFEEAEEFSSLAADSSLRDQQEQDYVTQKYSLSRLGRDYVEENLYLLLSDNQKIMLDNLKSRVTRASLGQLIEYVYGKYPDYTSKSKIAHRAKKS